MKIAMVAASASPLPRSGERAAGGLHTQVKSLAQATARRGHQVVVYTRRDHPALPDRVPLCDGATVEHVPAGPPEWLPAERVVPYLAEFGAPQLRRLGISYSRVGIVSPGVDLDEFHPRSIDRGRGAATRLLTLGPLSESSSVDDVICALPRVPGAELLVGGGPPADQLFANDDVARLRELAVRLGLQDRVTLVGEVPHSEVPELICSADVVICAPWYPRFGMVAVEAMACGVPIVASVVGGLRDTVLPGMTGDLVAAHSPDELALALRRLLGDSVRLQAYRFAATDRARAALSRGRVAVAIESVYLDVIGMPHAETESVTVA